MSRYSNSNESTEKPYPRGPRAAAVQALLRIERDGAFIDKILDEIHATAGEDRRDQSLAEHIIKGVLERREILDQELRGLVRDFARASDELLAILRVGLYQLRYLDRVPAHSVLFEAVEFAKVRLGPGKAKLVNGVLRNAQRAIKPESKSEAREESVLPVWLRKRWSETFGPERTEKLGAAMAREWPLFGRVNTLRASRDEVFQSLQSEGVVVHPCVYPQCSFAFELGENKLTTLKAFTQGLFLIQDASAALVALVCDPKPGQEVIDLCAAPGGKTTHLAALMGNEGTIHAFDLHGPRLKLIEENCARLGVTIVKCEKADGRFMQQGEADLVLIDAPCSGLGVLGRKRDALFNKSAGEIERLIELQRQLLGRATSFVRVGGKLVYSTCSIDPQENSAQVQWFQDNSPTFKLRSLKGRIPDEMLDAHGCLAIYPDVHGMGGAFAAVFERLS